MTTTSAGFRPATERDVASLVELVRRYYAENAYPYAEVDVRSAIVRLLTEPERGRIWVLDGDDRLAGYVVMTVGFSLEYRGPDAFIDELYLVPEERGRGLGKRAVALVEAECRQRGVRALHLEVERDNIPAQELYRAFGFTDHNRYLMTKLLLRTSD